MCPPHSNGREQWELPAKTGVWGLQPQPPLRLHWPLPQCRPLTTHRLPRLWDPLHLGDHRTWHFLCQTSNRSGALQWRSLALESPTEWHSERPDSVPLLPRNLPYSLLLGPGFDASPTRMPRSIDTICQPTTSTNRGIDTSALGVACIDQRCHAGRRIHRFWNGQFCWQLWNLGFFPGTSKVLHLATQPLQLLHTFPIVVLLLLGSLCSKLLQPLLALPQLLFQLATFVLSFAKSFVGLQKSVLGSLHELSGRRLGPWWPPAVPSSMHRATSWLLALSSSPNAFTAVCKRNTRSWAAGETCGGPRRFSELGTFRSVCFLFSFLLSGGFWNWPWPRDALGHCTAGGRGPRITCNHPAGTSRVLQPLRGIGRRLNGVQKWESKTRQARKQPDVWARNGLSQNGYTYCRILKLGKSIRLYEKMQKFLEPKSSVHFSNRCTTSHENSGKRFRNCTCWVGKIFAQKKLWKLFEYPRTRQRLLQSVEKCKRLMMQECTSTI